MSTKSGEQTLNELLAQQLWTFYFGLIPTDLQLYILSFLDIKSLVQVMRTSKQFLKMASDER